MAKYKLSIVIPVRNSQGTIKHTLKNTISAVDPLMCQIIVIDNASTDGTYESIKSLNNYKNLKIIHNKNLLSMSQNWESGLDFIEGEYVTYIGGDDGIISTGIHYLLQLIQNNNFDVIAWNKLGYRWPSYYNDSDLACAKFRPQVRNEDFFINAKRNRINVINKLDHSYLSMPNIYNSAIRNNIIKNIKKMDGVFFNAQTPDVYSGLRISYEIESYPFLLYPVTISGVSSYSNGIATFKSKSSTIGDEFLKLNEMADNQLDPTLPNIQSYTTCIADSYLKILLRTGIEKENPKINFSNVYKKTINHIINNYESRIAKETINDLLIYCEHAKKYIKDNKIYLSHYYNISADFEKPNKPNKPNKPKLRNKISTFLYEHKKKTILNNVELAEDYYNSFYKKINYYFRINNFIVINNKIPFRIIIKKILSLFFHIRLLIFKIMARNA